MIFLRKILFPFAVIYGWITSFRNFLYDRGILPSYSFPIPIIAVGNLTVGGTGKTPQIEYLVRLLSKDHRVAILSRGYKRSSKGFLLADQLSNAAMLGDEPYQMHLKFPQVQVAVDADRKNGIEQLLAQKNKPDIIVLDDAFQHRRVRAGFYILLTAFDDLYTDDWMLPAGNLRESRSGSKRADVIVVTKCPPDISEEDRNRIKSKLKTDKPLFFSCISYDDTLYSTDASLSISQIEGQPKLLIAGIAKPKPFFAYLQKDGDERITFPDHHLFDENDLRKIRQLAGSRLIITTEKDFVRLRDHLPPSQLLYLPIQTTFIADHEQFDQIIIAYVGTSTRNG